MDTVLIAFCFELKRGLGEYRKIFTGLVIGLLALVLLIFGITVEPSRDISTLRSSIVIVFEDENIVTRKLMATIFEDNFIKKVVRVQYSPSIKRAERMVASGEAEAAVVIASDFIEKIKAGGVNSLELIISAQAPIKGKMFEGMVVGFADAIAGVLVVPPEAARLVKEDISSSKKLPAFWVQESQLKGIRDLASIGGNLYIKKIEDGVNSLSLKDYYLVMMLVTMALFIGASQSRRLLQEMEDGVLGRVRLASPEISRVLMGKVAAMYLLTLFEVVVFAIIATAGVISTGVEGMFPLLWVCLLSVLLAQGIGLILIFLFPDSHSFQMWSDGIFLGLAVLGGGLTPAVEMSNFFRVIAAFTPHHHLMNLYIMLTYQNSKAIVLVSASIILSLIFLWAGFRANLWRWETSR
jgi:ABC-type multidrug transport system permease subunit